MVSHTARQTKLGNKQIRETSTTRVVNSATVIFGAKMAVKDECLQACRLSDPIICTSNMMLLTSHTKHVKRSLETSKIEKKAKSADLVVLLLSIIFKENQNFSKSFEQHLCQLECKLSSDQLVKTWTWRGETSIFVFFWVISGPKNGPLGPPYKKKAQNTT